MHRQHPKRYSEILQTEGQKPKDSIMYLLKLLSDHCAGTSLLMNETAIEF